MDAAETPGQSGIGQRIVSMLKRSLGGWPFAGCVIGLSTLLALSSIAPERSLDDWIVGLIVQGRGAQLGMPRQPLDAFAFTTGSHAENLRLMEQGVMLPWWSDPGLRLAFPRPLAAFSHWLDETLWPDCAALMHWHSLLWFVLLSCAVCALYRQLESSASCAGLSFALYALDDAHGATLGWIANRNALLAASFGCVTLMLHDRSRRGQSNFAGFIAVVAFGCAWASGELASGVLGYLVAYAVCLDSGAVRARLWSLSPYWGVCLAWRLITWRLGYGASGSGAYVDPLSDSVRFLAQAPFKWLSLLQGQFGLIPSDLAFLGSPAIQRVAYIGGALTVVFVAWLLKPAIRDAQSRFWLLGMLLSLLPMAATFPHDRSLLLVGLGAMPLVSRVLLGASSSSEPLVRTGRLARAGAIALGVVHLLWAPLLLPLRAAQMNLLGRLETRAFRDAFAVSELPAKNFIVLSAPNLLLVNYTLARRHLLRLPCPHSLRVLSGNDSEVRLERTAPNALTLTPLNGFLATPLERHYRARAAELRVGDTVRLASLSAEVLSSTSDGRPASVRFTFAEPLEQMSFLCWQSEAFEPCSVPELGHTRVLPPLSLAPLLLQAALARAPKG